MKGCAGAGSTQTRTCLALSNSHRAPVLFVFLHLSRPDGRTVWAGSGLTLLVLIDIEPCLEAFEP